MESESSDRLIDCAIWVIWQIGVIWCVPGDFRGQLNFRLYHMGIYTTTRLVKWLKLSEGRASGRPREGPGFDSRVCDSFQPRSLMRFFLLISTLYTCFGSSFSHCARESKPMRSAYVQVEINWKKRVQTFLVVHVDSRRRGTTPATAGGIAEKGS